MRTINTCRSDPDSEPDEHSWIQHDNLRVENAVMLTKIYGIDKNFFTSKELDEINEFIKKYELPQKKIKTLANVLIACPEIDDIKKVSTILAENKITHGAYFNTIDFEQPYLNEEDREYMHIGISNNNNILVTSYKSAKGLEAECVILYIPEKEYVKFINGDVGDQNDNVFYTLSTRPKSRLLFVTNFLLSKYI